jgi:hypothetical protein
MPRLYTGRRVINPKPELEKLLVLYIMERAQKKIRWHMKLINLSYVKKWKKKI